MHIAHLGTWATAAWKASALSLYPTSQSKLSLFIAINIIITTIITIILIIVIIIIITINIFCPVTLSCNQLAQAPKLYPS